MEHLQIKNEVIRILENRIESATCIPVEIGLASENYEEWLEENKAKTPLQIEDATYIYLSRLKNTGKLPIGFEEIQKYTVGPYTFECDGLNAPSMLRLVKARFGNGKQPKGSSAIGRSKRAEGLQMEMNIYKDVYRGIHVDDNDFGKANYMGAMDGDPIKKMRSVYVPARNPDKKLYTEEERNGIRVQKRKKLLMELHKESIPGDLIYDCWGYITSASTHVATHTQKLEKVA